MAVFSTRYAFLGTLSIEIDRIVVDPIEDPPNLGRSIDLHSSICICHDLSVDSIDEGCILGVVTLELAHQL